VDLFDTLYRYDELPVSKLTDNGNIEVQSRIIEDDVVDDDDDKNNDDDKQERQRFMNMAIVKEMIVYHPNDFKE